MNESTISEKNVLSDRLTDKQLTELERLAALNFTYEEMALYFELDSDQFVVEANDEKSRIYYHVRRGKLIVAAQEQVALLEDAIAGNVIASQQLGKIRRTREFEVSKKDVFGGFDDLSKFEKLQDYILSGSSSDLSADESIYLEALTLMNSMDRKYGRRQTITFFTKPPFKLTYAKARDMYDEAVNLFYTDRNIEKLALRHKKAEALDEMARIARQTAKTPKDLEIAANIMMQAAKLQELDRPDPTVLPKAVYQKPIRLFVLDPSQVGLGSINRHKVAEQIDQLNIPESVKIGLRGDAFIEDVKFEEILDELEEETQSEE